MRRVWTRGGAALALLAVTGWGWILHQGRDLASVDESGLLFEEPPVTPDENGAVKLQQAAGLLACGAR